MKKVGGAALVAAVLLLAGCAGEPASAPLGEDAPPTVSSTPDPMAVSPSPVATPSATADAAPVDGPYIVDDRLTKLQAVTSFVSTLQEPEPGRWVVSTTLIDPRGDDGSSEEARKAIEVCERAVELGASQVSVMEKNGTTFVLYGHPAYGDVCTVA